MIKWNLNLIFNISVLLCAAYKKNMEFIKELLAREDVDINIKDI